MLLTVRVVRRHGAAAHAETVGSTLGMPPGNDPKSIRVEGDGIHYTSPGGSWSMPIPEMRVMGEYTNSDGPFLDDYYLVFASTIEGWYEASYYAHGCGRFLTDLSERLGAALVLTLNASTDRASNVLWPPRLAGRKLFTFDRDPEGGFWEWLKYHTLGEVRQSFTPEVLEELQGFQPPLSTDAASESDGRDDGRE